MPVKKLTLTTVKALKPSQTLWDSELSGFGCRCQSKKKVFILKYSLHGRQRIFTIGEWNGSLTPEQARTEAEILRGQIRQGIDPMAEKKKDQSAPLVRNAFKEFLNEIEMKRSLRTHKEYKRIYEKVIANELENYKINAITNNDIERIHKMLKDKPYQANRVLALLSSFFSWCLKKKHRIDGINPCLYIEKFKEEERERFLSEEELYKLGQAIMEYEESHAHIKPPTHQRKEIVHLEINHVTQYTTSALRLLILTGARKNEILTLRWDDIDFERKQIRLKESKTGKKTIYLNAPALKLLNEIPRIQGNPYVICGKKDGCHLVNLKDPWNKIRKAAGLDDVRIHDLRHTYASTAVLSGQHMKIIGTLLGHADTKTTEKYAHLADDPLQQATEIIGNKLYAALTQKAERRDHNKAIKKLA